MFRIIFLFLISFTASVARDGLLAFLDEVSIQHSVKHISTFSCYKNMNTVLSWATNVVLVKCDKVVFLE